MVPGLSALMVVPNTCLIAWGTRRFAIAFAAGAASALALPPYGYIAILLVTFPCLVWLLDGAIEIGRKGVSNRFRAGFLIGWWFGLGYFLAGLWWVGSAFLVEADRFAWLIPFAVLAMPVGLALFTGVAIGVAARFWNDRWDRVLTLSVSLSAADWIKGHIFTGFPWNAFGYVFSDILTLAQSASLVGVYGLSFLAVTIFAMPAVLVGHGRLGGRVVGLVVAITLMAAMFCFGFVRLQVWEGPGDTELDIRIVQPAISQQEKWRPENRARIFQDYLDLSQRPLGGDARIGHQRMLIWPESAVPFLLTQEPGALFRISQILNSQTSLVTGAIRAEQNSEGSVYYNSVYLIDSDGAVRDVYDKVRLVPFGEYLPLQSLLARFGVEKLVDVPGTFRPGFRQKVLQAADGRPFLPLVCYEAIFPDLSGIDGSRPDWLLNVTNDAWFGSTPGPYQHFAQARMRAIEQGIPLVRAANTGISAIVGAKGRINSALPLLEAGVVDGRLPGRLSHTLYGTFGDRVFGLLVILSVVLSLFCKYNRYSRNN